MEIHILGGAWAVEGPGAPKRLEPRTAALLAYLALEGPTARMRLADLLWPASRESTARNNLRQLLRRLRNLLGQECVDGGDPLRLREGLVLDVLRLRAAFAVGEATVTSFAGELLEGCDYEGCGDLLTWLDTWRERLRELRHEVLDREVRRLEAQGLLPAALQEARQMLTLVPASEKAYFHVMRLSHLLGDRAAALLAWRQCREMMRREFGAQPSEETHELARAIEAHEASRRVPSPPPRLGLPLAVVSPPVLVGREREWTLMEEAWRTRRPMLLVGEAGIGKSRLMVDFARSRGRSVLIFARPGDQALPFSTHTRTLRILLAQRQGEPIPAWVRRELSRVLPELEPDPPPLPRSPEEKARLFSAAMELVRSCLRGVDTLAFDDAQYMDPDSAEMGIRAHAELAEEMADGRMPLILNTYREHDESNPRVLELMEDFAASELVVKVPVSRLDREGVRQMLRGMEQPALERISGELADYTGGNPLFIAETARHLLQSGTFDGSFPASLPPPGRVGAIIEHRVRHLPGEAYVLACVFAVARTDFSVDMASAVLERAVDELAIPWRQLEEAGIIRGRWFSHDLVCEVLLGTLPEPIYRELHSRVRAWSRRYRRRTGAVTPPSRPIRHSRGAGGDLGGSEGE